eukprot:TRINITY_DN13408_c0_g1_i1.p1 TRINITY_DN13408_c0_g1~~TRINITY_DN13408_c0_g1_i1.p1  ORF type:complete len:74 (+),score=11.95 TRINITY_DN13408_c0_g1_i1:75-296(+)
MNFDLFAIYLCITIRLFHNYCTLSYEGRFPFLANVSFSKKYLFAMITIFFYVYWGHLSQYFCISTEICFNSQK